MKKFSLLFKRKQEPISDSARLRQLGVETKDDSVVMVGSPIIECKNGGRIVLGRNVSLISDIQYNPAGINHPVFLIADGPDARIVIGDNSGISGTSIVTSSTIEIGNNVMIGANCNLFGTDFHCHSADKRRVQKSMQEAPSAPIIIEDDCWLGANVTVLKGVTIGQETIIGTMSLVNKSIPSHCLAAGVPAKVIRSLEQ